MHKNHNGFTLVELLVVMGIILILVSLGVPAVNSARNKAKDMEVKVGCNTIQTKLEQFAVDNGGYPGAQYISDSSGNILAGPGVIGGLPTYTSATDAHKDFYVPKDNNSSRGLSGLSGDPVYFTDGSPNPQQLDALVVQGYLTDYPPNPFLKTGGGLKAQMTNLFLFNPIMGDVTPVLDRPDTLDFNRYTDASIAEGSMRANYVDWGRGHFTYIPLNPRNNTGFDFVAQWTTGNLSDFQLSDYYKHCRGYMLIGWGNSRINDSLAKGISMKYWDATIDLDGDGTADGAFDFDHSLTGDWLEEVLGNVTAGGILYGEVQDSAGSVGAFGQVLPNGAASIDEAFFGAVYFNIP